MPDPEEGIKETLATGADAEGNAAEGSEDNAGSASEDGKETLLGGAKPEGEGTKEGEGEGEEKPAEGEGKKEGEGEPEPKKGEIADGKYKVDDYEIVVPEGQEFNAELLDSIVPVFQDLGLENDSVQKIVDGYADAVKTHVDGQIKKSMEYFDTVTEGWKKDSLKELGADSAKQLSIAAVAREKLGDKEFKEMLKETGVGNHPAMIRMLIKAGNLVKEDSFHDSNQPGKGEELNPEKVLYPSMNK